LRDVALASGLKRGEFIGDSKLSPIVSSTTIITIASFTRRSGHPISSWYQISMVYSMSIHNPSISLLWVFISYPEEAKKIRVHNFAIA
jgi:hypothetical protein